MNYLTSKTIYTSNYARIPQFTKDVEDANIIATSVWIARWHKNNIHDQRLDLAPTWEMVEAIKNEEIDEKEYEKQYRNLLRDRKINAKQLVDDLPNNTFLLCFESPTDFCHRHILADWVFEQIEFEIHEWMNPKELKEATIQKNLESLLDIE